MSPGELRPGRARPGDAPADERHPGDERDEDEVRVAVGTGLAAAVGLLDRADAVRDVVLSGSRSLVDRWRFDGRGGVVAAVRRIGAGASAPSHSPPSLRSPQQIRHNFVTRSSSHLEPRRHTSPPGDLPAERTAAPTIQGNGAAQRNGVGGRLRSAVRATDRPAGSRAQRVQRDRAASNHRRRDRRRPAGGTDPVGRSEERARRGCAAARPGHLRPRASRSSASVTARS